MSGIDNWNNQINAMSRATEVFSSTLGQIQSAYGLDNMTSAINRMSKQLSAFNNINTEMLSSLSNIAKQYETFNVIRGIDFSKAFAIMDLVPKIEPNYNFLAISSALQKISIADYSTALVGMSSALKMYDAVKFDYAVQGVFEELDWKRTNTVSDIIGEVVERYIEDNDIEELASEEIREVVTVSQGALLTDKQLRVWEVYIYPFLISLLFFIMSFIPAQNAGNINVTQVNNYYTTEIGMDADNLNSLNFRIICEDNVKPRIKPDCSSKVTGLLMRGNVVCITGKYKKWIEITWKNSTGECVSGWIQNYKVEKFK